MTRAEQSSTGADGLQSERGRSRSREMRSGSVIKPGMYYKRMYYKRVHHSRTAVRNCKIVRQARMDEDRNSRQRRCKDNAPPSLPETRFIFFRNESLEATRYGIPTLYVYPHAAVYSSNLRVSHSFHTMDRSINYFVDRIEKLLTCRF